MSDDYAELGRSIAEAILEEPLRFRVERWVEDRGWVCIVEENERRWAEVAAYTGLAIYDGDYRVVDTKTGECEHYRRQDDEFEFGVEIVG